MNEEITVYYKSSCGSCRKAIKFFHDQGIPIQEVNIKNETISPTVLFSVLQYTENGLSDMLKGNIKEEELERFENMSVMEFISFITKSPANQFYLRTPLIVQGNGERKINIGYNVDEVRTFLPADVKHKLLEELYSLEQAI